MDTKDKLIEKLKELIKLHISKPIVGEWDVGMMTWKENRRKLESEIAALEKQVEEQESKPLMTAEEILNNIFNDLQKNAYDLDLHVYHYKEANQIIRKHFEYLFLDLKPNKMKAEEMYVKNKEAILKCMEDYHQSRLKEIMPTDEEIEKRFPTIDIEPTLRVMNVFQSEGTKWFKSEIEKRNKF